MTHNYTLGVILLLSKYPAHYTGILGYQKLDRLRCHQVEWKLCQERVCLDTSVPDLFCFSSSGFLMSDPPMSNPLTSFSVKVSLSETQGMYVSQEPLLPYSSRLLREKAAFPLPGLAEMPREELCL